MGDIPLYKQLVYWVQTYGSAGIPDQRAVSDFMDCETDEMVRSFQSELICLSRGNYKPESIDQLVGQGRKQKYGSYEEWARLMLMWLSSYKG